MSSEAYTGDDSTLSIERLVDLAPPGIIPFQRFHRVYDIDAWPNTLDHGRSFAGRKRSPVKLSGKQE